MKSFAAGVLAATAGVASADGHGGHMGVTPMDMLHSGLPIKYPVDLHTEDGVLMVELDYTTCDYAGPFSVFTTRCYAHEGVGMMPGPTLHMHAGEKLIVKLSNHLSDADNIEYHNFWQHLNYTNLHFHGAHISADVPADDVLTMIHAVDSSTGDVHSITYEYELAAYHMGGTAWYHPHGHGSATMQTGTGTSGMIIIEDKPGDVPEYIADAPQIYLNMLHMPLEDIMLWGMQTCISSSIMTPSLFGSEGMLPMGPEFEFPPGSGEHPFGLGESGLLLVNMMTNPVINLDAGVWYRMRILMSSPLYMVNGQGQGEMEVMRGCSFGLLAKDSIYIDDPMRPISRVFLYPGSRADIMVRCNVPGHIQFNSAYFEGQEALTRHIPNYIGAVWQWHIVETGLAPEVDLPAFEVQRPCYLANTQSALGNEEYVTKKPIVYDICEKPPMGPPPPGPEHRKLPEEDAVHRELAELDELPVWHYDEYPGFNVAMQIFGAPSCSFIADNIFSAKTGAYCINGCPFELGQQWPIGSEFGSGLMNPEDPAAAEAAAKINAYQGHDCVLAHPNNFLQVGDIIEWDVWGIDWHPVHFHVHPYRLVDMDFSDGNQAGQVIPNMEAFWELTGNFYHIGDYGDTMMVPVKHAKFHQNLANFATLMINHCHILLHEDLGMMTLFIIEGEDGTLTRAQEIDPTCYWVEEEKVGYSITSSCESDAECPAGFMCSASMDEHHRTLKFGFSTPKCVKA